MHNITPIADADRQTVESLAEAAVHNSIPLDEANVFPNTNQRCWFRTAYLKYEAALEAVD